jgi:hypothetical protein
MNEVIVSQIDGQFTGFHGDAIFKLANGQVWQQRRYRYRYKYAYRPSVKIYRGESGRWMMDVDVMSDSIEVVRVNIIENGAIASEFHGFDGHSIFKFDNGRIWEQSEYKYSYHYAYRPNALVVEGINGTELHVDGMSETIKVRQIR